jgi:hypothetical protein
MATLSELAGTIAEAEGMDPATVALIARYVREAGLIEKKGRGPSAARMGAKDAANLLIAVNASSSAREAPAVVPVYRDLIAANDGSETAEANGTFGEALELVIESAIERKLPSTLLSKEVPEPLRDAFENGNATISIHFKRPELSGRIFIGSPQEVTSALPGMSSTWRIPAQVTLVFLPMRTPPKRNVVDRSDETVIGSTTIFRIAKTLRSRSQHERKAE